MINLPVHNQGEFMKYAGFLSFLIFGFLFSANCERAKVEQNVVKTASEIVEKQSENRQEKTDRKSVV